MKAIVLNLTLLSESRNLRCTFLILISAVWFNVDLDLPASLYANPQHRPGVSV
jgi:hypothetical protein